jgi:ribosome-binding factor A
MNTDRITRVNELLRREIAEALFHVMNEANLDLSAITITRVIASRNLRNARVLVSIRDNVERRKSIIGMLVRHRVAMQAMINKDCQLKFTPRLVFELDPSLEKGDHVLAVLSKLEIPETEPEENVKSDPDGSPELDENTDD